MKLFEVDLSGGGYDTYNGCIIAADSEKEVFEKIENNNVGFFVAEDQRVTVTEINLAEIKETKILMASFSAG